MIKTKVLLTGNFGVGKTSLFQRFLFSKFDEKYLTTIGVKVDKKTLTVNDDEVQMFLWDLAGEVSQDKVPLSYFLGAHGIVYVLDLARPMTYQNIASDIAYLRSKAKNTIIKIVGNKKDLLTDEQIQKVLDNIAIKPDILTSAKTGDNIEALFQGLANEMHSKFKK
jgi:small GTP-binding protein